VALLGIAAVLIARRFGADNLPPWLIPAIIFTAGVALVWSPLDSAVHSDPRRPNVAGLFEREAWFRTLAGLVLCGGALWWFARWEFTQTPWVRGVVVPTVLIGGAALLLAPWWMRLIRQVGVERQQRIREYERAEIAAHLHDSVLQTLTLIRAKSHDADAVSRLARAQERDLRNYLYQARRSVEESVATALATCVNEVEDAHAVAIDTVTVGDSPTTDAFRAAVMAAREAAANAARHGVEPISVYAELTPATFEIFVRDSGPGFDPGKVPGDRLGIRNSIIGRVKRHGGTATVTSVPGGRTEVAITMPREEQR
jgi:signal transduction histidine kinase